MKILYNIVFTPLVFSLFSFYQVFPQESDYKPIEDSHKIIKEFRTKQNSVSTLSCVFRQVKYISYLSAQIESSGKFYFKKANSIRWEYVEPYQYAIVIDEGKLKIEGNNNDIQYKIRENKYIERLNDLIQDSFCGDIFSDDNYDAILEESSKEYRLKLIPKEDEIKNIIAMVYLYFNKQTLSVSGIVIHEPSKDNTTIFFTDHVFNSSLDIDLFK